MFVRCQATSRGRTIPSMSDVAIRAESPPDKPKRQQIRGKLRQALDAMVWEGLEYDQAARTYNFHVRSMRRSLQSPHVLAYLRHEREVLRASLAPRNIHRLREIRDAENNMPAVNAIKLLEQIGDEQPRYGATNAMPGVTVRIINVVNASNANDLQQSPIVDATVNRQISTTLDHPDASAVPGIGHTIDGEGKR
jgi:hypothetical protein